MDRQDNAGSQRERARPAERFTHNQMSIRTSSARRPGAPLALAGRAAADRRRQRRTLADPRLYCATNGCASFLDLDPLTGVASCAICGFSRQVHASNALQVAGAA
jgi:hypothetical protein